MPFVAEGSSFDGTLYWPGHCGVLGRVHIRAMDLALSTRISEAGLKQVSFKVYLLPNLAERTLTLPSDCMLDVCLLMPRFQTLLPEVCHFCSVPWNT